MPALLICSCVQQVQRELELPLLDEAGRRTGASLTVQAELTDIGACKAEAAALQARLKQAGSTLHASAGQLQQAHARLAAELQLLSREMAADAQQAAADAAARIMREMQAQLAGFIEAEEALCASAEATITAESEAAVSSLEAACDVSVDALSTEKAFYPTHAPELLATAARLRARWADEMLASAQQAGLRLVRIAGDFDTELLSAVESRLHQATDYQIVLQREAVERAREATLLWVALPVRASAAACCVSCVPCLCCCCCCCCCCCTCYTSCISCICRISCTCCTSCLSCCCGCCMHACCTMVRRCARPLLLLLAVAGGDGQGGARPRHRHVGIAAAGPSPVRPLRRQHAARRARRAASHR